MVNALEVIADHEGVGLDTELEINRGRNYGNIRSRGTRVDHYPANNFYNVVFYPIGDEVKIRNRLRINEPSTKEVPGHSYEDVERDFSERVRGANIRPGVRSVDKDYIIDSYNKEDMRMIKFFIEIL